MNELKDKPQTPRLVWPRYLLAAFVLAVLLAILWMSVAVHRLRQYRDPTFPSNPQPATTPATTNAGASVQSRSEIRTLPNAESR